jgi:hypothetical protein
MLKCARANAAGVRPLPTASPIHRVANGKRLWNIGGYEYPLFRAM